MSVINELKNRQEIFEHHTVKIAGMMSEVTKFMDLWASVQFGQCVVTLTSITECEYEADEFADDEEDPLSVELIYRVKTIDLLDNIPKDSNVTDLGVVKQSADVELCLYIPSILVENFSKEGATIADKTKLMDHISKSTKSYLNVSYDEDGELIAQRKESKVDSEVDADDDFSSFTNVTRLH